MKKAIVVGASSGIGRELARLLAENGYVVGITGRRQALLEDLRQSAPGQYLISSFDASDESSNAKLSALAEALGGLDLLILSAGMGDLNDALDPEIEQKTNRLNVLAFTEVVTWAYRCFEKQGYGQLAAITSIGGLRGSGAAPAYNASKAYQINYLEGLRQKAKKSGKPIFVTDICPGFVDTAMAKGEGLFWVAPVEKAARQIFRAIQRKRGKVYVTKRWAFLARVLKRLPDWIYMRM